MYPTCHFIGCNSLGARPICRCGRHMRACKSSTHQEPNSQGMQSQILYSHVPHDEYLCKATWSTAFLASCVRWYCWPEYTVENIAKTRKDCIRTSRSREFAWAFGKLRQCTLHCRPQTVWYSIVQHTTRLRARSKSLIKVSELNYWQSHFGFMFCCAVRFVWI